MSIPRTFHRVWFPADETDVVPPKFEGFWTKLQELHPDWDFITHDDPDEVAKWLTNKALFQRVREAAEADPTRYKDLAYGSLPDIVRYEICNKFGGVYIDVDFEPLKPFDELIARDKPFIAWESMDLVCCALMGGPPGHPAFADLVEALPAHAAKNWDEPAVGRTGPKFITQRWLERTDVLRLPPSTFYPVSWNEKERLGGPYPEETIAVHHWNAGWIPKSTLSPKPKPVVERLVVLVPWRCGDPDREYAWEQVKARWEASGHPLFVADSPGPKFNRAAAINEAARLAGDWDVAIIADADTWDNVASCRTAARAAMKLRGAVVPWTVRHKLSREGTKRFVEMEGRKSHRTEDLDTTDPTRPHGVDKAKRGGTIVVSRKAFDAVGGFDEGFTDWGYEDRAFRLAVDKLSRLREAPSTCWHLWHPLASRNRKGTPAGQKRFARYQAVQTGGEMEKLLRELGVL